MASRACRRKLARCASARRQGPATPETPPLVAIFNNLENQHTFLDRSAEDGLVPRMFRRGERALFWLGPRKLVALSTPPQHLEYVRQLGYGDTLACAPERPSVSICTDIRTDPELCRRLVDYAGPERALTLVPYVTTPELLGLAAVLRTEHHLTVSLPESPAPEDLWVRDYVDRKSGFRQMAADVLDEPKLPPGFVCHDIAEAKAVATWFGAREKACIAKADRGNSGFGHVIVQRRDPLQALDEAPLLRDDLVIVEECIPSATFPSVELFVPRLGQGQVRLTYACVQILDGSHFGGVVIEAAQRQAGWYEPLVAAGLTMGRQLQSMGYAGHFDLDAVVDAAGRTMLLELNARRTGGTHVHEFGCFSLGPDYAERATLIAHAELACPAVASFEQLRDQLRPLLYPIEQQPRGVVVTNAPAADDRTFGCIVVGQDSGDALRLQDAVLAHVS